MTFIIQGLNWSAEQDSYHDGCLMDGKPPAAGWDGVTTVDFSADTTESMLEQLASWLDVSPSDIETNACDEPGRVDIARTEDIDGNPATAQEIEQWKQGKLDLWYVVYHGQLKQIEEVSF